MLLQGVTMFFGEQMSKILCDYNFFHVNSY
jgi:hypothetical protein